MRFIAATLALLLAAGPAFGQSYANPMVKATGSTTARGVADRAGEVLNVRDFGAKCDGASDDYTAINAAMTKAGTIAGSTVYFPPSATKCLVSQAIVVPANTTLQAQPGTVTLAPKTGNVSSPLLLTVANVSNVRVIGLGFDGGGVDFASGNNIVTVFTASNVVFDNITEQNTRGIGIMFSTAVTNSGVRNSTFSNIGNHWITTTLNADQQQGVGFCCGTRANSHENFVTGSYFTNIGLDAISIADQVNFTANNNVFKSVGGRYTNGGAAIYAAANSALTAVGNTVNGTFGNGIDVITTNLANITGNNVQFAGGAGIDLAQSSWGTIIGNTSCNNNQSAGLSTLQAGIALAGSPIAVTETTIAGNTVCDTQVTPTQTWGIQEVTGGTYTNVWVDQSNTPDGNVTGPFGQALAGYTPLKLGTTVGGITQTGTNPNQGVALLPTGTGALMAAVPNSLATGGNVRGSQAVDWQGCRSNALQVASGVTSIIGGGCNNTASGQFSAVPWGQWNVATATATAYGSFANTEFRNSVIASANGDFSVQGDAQNVDVILRASTTTATPVGLTSTGGGDANSTNILNLGQASQSVNHALRVKLQLVARSSADVKEWSCDYLMSSGSGSATVVLVGSSCSSVFATGGAAAWTVALTADTTNGGITMSATGAAATTIHWVASAHAVEVL